MDLLLGVAPKPAPAASAAAPADGQTPAILLEETGELLSEEIATPEPPAEPVVEVVAVEAPVDEAVATVATVEPVATSEPAATPLAPKPRRKRSRAPTPVVTAPTAESSTTEPAEGSVEPAGEDVVTVSLPPSAQPAGRRRRDPDEDLEPAYIPIKVTVSIPAVVLSELIRTVQTIRRMTGRRQPVNQGTVIAAALEMAFEEFRTKGATSQLVDKLRIE